MQRELHDTIAARLRRTGQRYTDSRRALIELLARAGQPLPIPGILARGKGLPQSSVYRNLVVLEQCGAIHRLATGEGFARYELAEDLTEHHHHLVCTSCGTVEDLPASTGLERSVKQALSATASRRGFKPRAHRIDLMGTCRNCG